jgi:hypothetical protein
MATNYRCCNQCDNGVSTIIAEFYDDNTFVEGTNGSGGSSRLG